MLAKLISPGSHIAPTGLGCRDGHFPSGTGSCKNGVWPDNLNCYMGAYSVDP